MTERSIQIICITAQAICLLLLGFIYDSGWAIGGGIGLVFVNLCMER